MKVDMQNIYCKHIKHLCEDILGIKMYKSAEHLFKCYSGTFRRIFARKLRYVTNHKFIIWVIPSWNAVRFQAAEFTPETSEVHNLLFASTVLWFKIKQTKCYLDYFRSNTQILNNKQLWFQKGIPECKFYRFY